MSRNQIPSLISRFLRLADVRTVGPAFIPRRHLSLSSTLCSRYPKYYIHPVYEEEELKQLKETGEADKLAFVPVRAAPVNQSNSVWHDPLLVTFTNMVMKKGRKEIARYELERCWRNLKRIQLKKYYEATTDAERDAVILNPWELFHRAIQNCTPLLETTPITRGGTRYQVPVPVSELKGQFLAMKWLLEATRNRERRKFIFFYEQLAFEILDAANDTGKVVKRKQDLHKICEANRAYAHFRWS